MDINKEIINKELERIGIPLDHDHAMYFRDGVKFAITEQLTLTDVGCSETELPNIESKEFKIWYEANKYEATPFNNILSKDGLDYPLENIYKHYCNLLEFGN